MLTDLNKTRAAYEWAINNTEHPKAKEYLDLALLYARRQDIPTLGLIDGCANQICREFLGGNNAR